MMILNKSNYNMNTNINMETNKDSWWGAEFRAFALFC